jgi:hypothetical protein
MIKIHTKTENITGLLNFVLWNLLIILISINNEIMAGITNPIRFILNKLRMETLNNKRSLKSDEFTKAIWSISPTESVIIINIVNSIVNLKNLILACI